MAKKTSTARIVKLAREFGAQAFHGGRKLSDNAFVNTDALWHEWRRGFIAARTAEQAARRSK